MQDTLHTYLELIVGVFVALGLGALLLLSLQVSGFGSEGVDGYRLSARFSNVGQLKPRAPVRMAGVKVGLVQNVTVDASTLQALITMEIDHRFSQIPIDSSAGIYTSGLLGEQYVALQPGGDDIYLQDGDELEFTSSAVVLEEVIGKFLFSKAAGDD